MKHVVEIASYGMIYMENGTGAQGTLRLFLSNSRGSNAGITDGRNL
jgi:hypothetical protein